MTHAMGAGNGAPTRPTAVLVHGGLLGSWCWDKVVAELAARGLESVTVDLPIEDPAAGAAAYADVVVRSADGLPSVVLVGHSMSGVCVPLAAHRLPIRHLVLVGAVLPVPGQSMAEQFAADPALVSEAQQAFQFDELGRFCLPEEDARRVYFHDCPDDVATWAAAKLRPQASTIATEITPLHAWPQVPSTYVLCTEDRAMPPAWGRRVVPERLGITPVEIPGGHAPFLSRPARLAEIIAAAAAPIS